MMTSKETTILHIDHGTPLPEQILLLEGRLGALRGMKEEFLSERDKRNGYTWRDLEKKTLHRILFCLGQMVDQAIHESEREVLFAKYQQTREEIAKMEKVDGWNNKKENPSDERKALNAIIELRKAREIITSQLNEVKTRAKSKISALKKSEDHLLEMIEETDQPELFKFQPEISEECRKIIANPGL